MSARAPDRLAELLPTGHRMRDVEVGGPLEALLRVITEQVQVVDENIAQLYENWFIETCEPWVVSYIGDLIGYLPGSPVTISTSVSLEEQARELRVAIPRRDVAHTIGDRRRKGTLALLEDLAADAAGWPSRAVEFYRLLALAQSLDHLRLDRGRTVDLRDGDALDRLDGPFDELGHTVSVGRLTSSKRRTRFDIPTVGLYVWRLRPYSVTKAPAFCIDRARTHYTFSALGNDAPLITKPVAEPSRTHIADETNVPAWIRRRAFDDRTADYYGPLDSLAIWRDSPPKLVPVDDIVAADLSQWAYEPEGEQVAVDPVLGRIAFSSSHAPEEDVVATYHYGFSADMGGGEYPRALTPTAGRPVYAVGPGRDYATIGAAIAKWQADREEDPSKRSAIIEIRDSGAYSEPIDIALEPGDRLELRAANGTRPLIRLLDRSISRPDSLRVRGLQERSPDDEGYEQPEDGAAYREGAPAEREQPSEAPQIVFDGLLISGRSVRISGWIECVVFRDCTLVPGWSLEHDCEPHAEEPSLELDGFRGRVLVRRTILGGILVRSSAGSDPIPVSLGDSILDATNRDAPAICGAEGTKAHSVLTIVRSTVIGHVGVHAIELAENTIFEGIVRVVRSQLGCIRYCYVAPGSRTPARHRCQPDVVEAEVRDSFARGELTAGERDRALVREARRVRPQFNSLRYGTPRYCQLAETCAPEITRAADDESELGAFHDLFEPEREANLKARLEEYSPAGSEAGIVFVT